MSIKIINLGTEPDGLGGDTLRSSATKTNENFTFVNTELNGINSKLNESKTEMLDKNTRVTNLESKTDTTNSNLINTDKKVSDLEIKTNTTNSNLSSTDIKVAALEVKTNTTNSGLASTDVKVKALEDKNIVTDSSINNSNTKITALEVKTTATDNALSTSNTKIKALEDKNVLTDNKISTNTTSTAANTTELDKINTYINKATNAASKEVGTTTGKIPLAENIPTLAKTSELQTSITAILGINKKLTNRINALEESNISSLFNNGANNGIWLDPSDLKTMFQDITGTVPVTKDGDPVGLMLDKSQAMELSDNLTPLINFNDGSRWVKGHPSNEISEDGKTILTTTTAGGISLTGLNNGWYKLSVGYTVAGASFQIRDGYGGKQYSSTSINSPQTLIIYISNNSLSFRTSLGQSSLTIPEMVLQELKGNHASQPLAASRPTYRTDGVLHWLEFDGVDDSLDVNVAATDNFDISLSFNYKDKSAGATFLLRYNGTSYFIFGSNTNAYWNLFSVGDGTLEDTDRRNKGIKVITAYASTPVSRYIGQSGKISNLPTGLARTVNSLQIGSSSTHDLYGFILRDSSQFYPDMSKQLHSYMQRKAGVEI